MASMNPLTSDEINQLQLIVQNAHREGWISASSALTAERSGAGDCVVVTATHGPRVVQRAYESDARWPFRLLRDLAWGAYA
jgi:hypothetical protein